MGGWLRADSLSEGTVVVAAIGNADVRRCRCLVLEHGRLGLRLGANDALQSVTAVTTGSWHSIEATYDGRIARLYLDAVQIDARTAITTAITPALHLAPENAADPAGEDHFGGALALFLLDDHALTAEQIRKLHAARPDFGLVDFDQVGVGWPWQEHAWRGLRDPQPAWTLPHGKAPFSRPTVSIESEREPALRRSAEDVWRLGGWHLAAAPIVRESPARLSNPDYPEAHWYSAVVPGTVLTTLIANGVFPDPDIGLNNLAIPESLNRHDYWYRTRFVTPRAAAGRRLTLSFKGINYAAEVWLNGSRLGSIRGAFIRGAFDVTALLRPGAANAVAVRVSPPPHPGIPHEQSVAAGPGENGGSLAIDGPTFIATEGWDWIPAIRDRDTGLWQDVELTATGIVRILDPQVVTLLPLARIDSASVVIRVPVENSGTTPVHATIQAVVDGKRVSKDATLNPGESAVVFDPAEYQALHLDHPRLWWPNGYGSPELYTLKLTALVGGTASDTKSVRFGVRQLTYELSLFDHAGNLRRVDVDPTTGSSRHEQLVDVRHKAIKRTASGWAESLTPAGEASPAVRDLAETSLTPYLVIRVNGVRIAARGGSWGMDDSRKRVSRARLEPYFRLHRRAHLNIIRNWLGQNTEEVFYDLADEYGMLVLNDFWESTQDFQVEAQDPQLFLANARDVIRRYRNHPSIAVWFGRNEGVPQPILNEGLADLVATEDGTRYYTGSSNAVNLQGSGPYDWRPPEQYFLDLARGFSVEVGTPSLASLESLQKWIPQADRWPLGDVYAYHDWHSGGGNGDTASFMQALSRSFGTATSLPDFERKAQLMNYVSYRAIFEGFQANLWTRNSGRLLWMTHPSWPSNTWQIYTSDYDTPAAYYAVAKACEPLHAQLNLPDFSPAIVNIGRTSRTSLRLASSVRTLDDRVLLQRVDQADVPANSVATLAPLALQPLLAAERLVFVVLTLTDERGQVVSHNLYWEARSQADQKRLTTLAQQTLEVSVHSHPDDDDPVFDVALTNRGETPALLAKLVALDAAGKPVLPAFYSDNDLSLMPNESEVVTVRCPHQGRSCSSLALRGWNVAPVTVPVTVTTQHNAHSQQQHNAQSQQ